MVSDTRPKASGSNDGFKVTCRRPRGWSSLGWAYSRAISGLPCCLEAHDAPDPGTRSGPGHHAVGPPRLRRTALPLLSLLLLLLPEPVLLFVLLLPLQPVHDLPRLRRQLLVRMLRRPH